jgi:hypothetical protein
MANIRKLTTRALNELSLSNTFIYLMNTATNVESRISLSSLVGENSLSTGSGVSIYSGVVNNVLNFKSILSSSSILTITDNTTDLTLGISSGDINLNSCNNATSAFLSTVDLTANVGATILPVANGGTGAATLTDGGILLGSGTGAVTAMAALAAGTIIQGDGTTDPATLAVGAAGQVLTVNAGATAVEWAAAAASDNLGNHIATTTLDMANNNIDLGTGTINYTGVATLGLSFDSNNRAHLIPTGATATGGTEGLNISGSIFLKGDSARSLTVGSPASGNGTVFTINGSIPGTSSDDGGAIDIKPGASTSGDGGDLNLYAGSSASGAAGDISLLTRSGSSTTFPILRIANDKKVSIQNSSSNKTPLGLLDVQQTEVSGAIPVLSLKQADQNFAFAQFTGTAAADGTMNISTSTATSAAKTGAIKVKIQNGTDTATEGWVRIWADAV